MDFVTLGIGIVTGLCIGGFAASAFFGKKLAVEREATIASKTRQEEQEKHFTESQARMEETFAKLSQDSLSKNSTEFLRLAQTKFDPLKELLEKSNKTSIELRQSTSDLETNTSRLMQVLRNPNHRGKWGEVGLRNAVEFAGLSGHCDFSEQVITSGEKQYKPDMVVNLPGGGQIVLDSKLPLEHYMNALEDAEHAEQHLDKHVQMVEQHIKTLASKAYWEQFKHAPKFVILFVNIESAVVAAYNRKPEIHESALKKQVHIATPTTLIALLQTIAFAFRQEAIANNAEEIAQVGKELFERLATFRDHFQGVHDGLKKAATSYNKAVGSFERNLTTSARRLSELEATDGKTLEGPESLEGALRELKED